MTLPLTQIFAWARLYFVGVIVLLLQLVRYHRRNVNNRPWDVPNSRITYIVSGSTSGIGKALCVRLRSQGATIIELTLHNNGGVFVDLRDLLSLPAVVRTVRSLIVEIPFERRQRIVLLHAAGVLYSSPSEIFAVNVHAPAILSVLLADIVHRVVFLGSAAYIAAPTLNAPYLKHPLHSKQAYPASKRLLFPLAAVIAQQFRIRTVVIHPGVVNTSLYTGEPSILRYVITYLGWTPEHSATRICGLLPTDDTPIATYCDTTNMSQIGIDLLTNNAECEVVSTELNELVNMIKRNKH